MVKSVLDSKSLAREIGGIACGISFACYLGIQVTEYLGTDWFLHSLAKDYGSSYAYPIASQLQGIEGLEGVLLGVGSALAARQYLAEEKE